MDINEESSQEGFESFKGHNDHDSRILEDSKAELLSYIKEDNQDLPAKSVTHELACALPLMAELLEDLEEKNGLTAGAPDLVCILHICHKRLVTIFPDDLRCITVQILSRILEAKLTVCHCLLAESTKERGPNCQTREDLIVQLFLNMIANYRNEVGQDAAGETN
ncbi:hypothetical protein BHE74_00023321, partial [Ensete ventricosum]